MILASATKCGTSPFASSVKSLPRLCLIPMSSARSWTADKLPLKFGTNSRSNFPARS